MTSRSEMEIPYNFGFREYMINNGYPNFTPCQPTLLDMQTRVNLYNKRHNSKLLPLMDVSVGSIMQFGKYGTFRLSHPQMNEVKSVVEQMVTEEYPGVQVDWYSKEFLEKATDCITFIHETWQIVHRQRLDAILDGFTKTELDEKLYIRIETPSNLCSPYVVIRSIQLQLYKLTDATTVDRVTEFEYAVVDHIWNDIPMTTNTYSEYRRILRHFETKPTTLPHEFETTTEQRVDSYNTWFKDLAGRFPGITASADFSFPHVTIGYSSSPAANNYIRVMVFGHKPLKINLDDVNQIVMLQKKVNDIARQYEAAFLRALSKYSLVFTKYDDVHFEITRPIINFRVILEDVIAQYLRSESDEPEFSNVTIDQQPNIPNPDGQDSLLKKTNGCFFATERAEATREEQDLEKQLFDNQCIIMSDKLLYFPTDQKAIDDESGTVDSVERINTMLSREPDQRRLFDERLKKLEAQTKHDPKKKAKLEKWCLFMHQVLDQVPDDTNSNDFQLMEEVYNQLFDSSHDNSTPQESTDNNSPGSSELSDEAYRAMGFLTNSTARLANAAKDHSGDGLEQARENLMKEILGDMETMLRQTKKKADEESNKKKEKEKTTEVKTEFKRPLPKLNKRSCQQTRATKEKEKRKEKKEKDKVREKTQQSSHGTIPTNNSSGQTNNNTGQTSMTSQYQTLSKYIPFLLEVLGNWGLYERASGLIMSPDIKLTDKILLINVIFSEFVYMYAKYLDTANMIPINPAMILLVNTIYRKRAQTLIPESIVLLPKNDQDDPCDYCKCMKDLRSESNHVPNNKPKVDFEDDSEEDSEDDWMPSPQCDTNTNTTTQPNNNITNNNIPNINTNTPNMININPPIMLPELQSLLGYLPALVAALPNVTSQQQPPPR